MERNDGLWSGICAGLLAALLSLPPGLGCTPINMPVEPLPPDPCSNLVRQQTLYFETNSDRVRYADRWLIESALTALRTCPQAEIRIEGHTDRRGSDAYNQKLSLKRAEALRLQLIERGIAPDRLVAVGLGSSRPLRADDSPEAHSLNRRVTLNFVDPGPSRSPAEESLRESLDPAGRVGVAPQPSESASLAERVRAAIPYELSSARLSITADAGVVTLGGSVPSLLEKHRVLESTAATQGVRAVVDHVDVAHSLLLDGVVQGYVEQALALDPVTEPLAVDVAVENGIARLTGQTDARAERSAVENLTREVAGVRGIVNEITVVPRDPPPDDELRRDVLRHIRSRTDLRCGLVYVVVEGGAARLHGVVGTLAEKQRVSELAWVSGVKQVDTSAIEVADWMTSEALRTRWQPETDFELRETLRVVLRDDPRLHSLDLDVLVAGGVVTLRGEVPSLEARRRAEAAVADTVGVADVRSSLGIELLTPDTSDALIQQRARSFLGVQTDLELRSIQVSVDSGHASLTGTVASRTERERAADAVKRIRGVIGVTNSLQVVTPTSG